VDDANDGEGSAGSSAGRARLIVQRREGMREMWMWAWVPGWL
jgi:hypothetical protein